MTVLELLDIDDLNTDPDIISSLPKQCIIAEDKIVVRSIRLAFGDSQTA